MKRGEIWWADLGSPRASEPGFRRPVLVVQSDSFNRSRIGTVVIAIITSSMRLGRAPGNVVLSRGQSKLRRESIVNVSQLMTVDRAFLVEKVRKLPATTMREVDAGMRRVLELL